MEGLHQIEANLVVYLHPSKANSPGEAILGELSYLLFTYNESFDGIVLAYDAKISSNLAQIISGISPYLGVKLRADLLIFRPKPGMMVEGEVVDITPHAISAVLLGFSSASIDWEDVRGEFRFRSRKGAAYVSRVSKKHKIRVGTILRFRVKAFDWETLHVSGSMVGGDTGCARWLDKNVDVWNQVESTEVKREIEKVEESKKSAKVKLEEGDGKKEFGLEVNEEMPSLKKDGDEKSKKSNKTRVRQEEGKVVEEIKKSANIELEGNVKRESGLEVNEEMPSLKKDGGEKSNKTRVREEEGKVVEEIKKSANIELEGNVKRESGLEVNEEMPSMKDGEKSKKTRVREEQGQTEEKPKKLKKRRKEQS